MDTMLALDYVEQIFRLEESSWNTASEAAFLIYFNHQLNN